MLGLVPGRRVWSPWGGGAWEERGVLLYLGRLWLEREAGRPGRACMHAWREAWVLVLV